MIDPRAYLEVLKKQAFQRRGWDFADEGRQPDEYDVQLRNKILQTFSPDSMPDGVEDTGYSTKLRIQLMGKTLHEDLVQMAGDELRESIQNTAVGFLPTGKFNGFCVGRTDERQALDGYVIGINYGLYYCCSLLGEAIVREALDLGLPEQERVGRPAFQNAVRLFLNPTMEQHEEYFSRPPLPADVAGTLTSASSANCTIMLFFVGLHELGHITNGDVDSKSGVVRFDIAASEPIYARGIVNAKGNWESEYLADDFAIRKLALWSSDQNRWNNFATIVLFFEWLQHIEDELGKSICPFHPQPSERLARLWSTMQNLYGEPPDEGIAWLESRIEEWKKHSHDE